MELVANHAGHADLRQVVIRGLKAVGVDLWHLEFNKIPEGYEFLVYIDGDSITADVCSDAARHLIAVLGVEGFAANEIFVDVSSPGINRGLYSIDHCNKFLGHTVRCDFSKSGFLVGVLLGVDGDDIILELQHGASIDIKFDDINRINLQEN